MYTDLSCGDLKLNLFKSNLLIITATETESIYLHSKLLPIDPYKNIIRVFNGANTYYIGLFGLYSVIHVQCNMGSIGRSAAIATLIDSINVWKPKALVMIGIAFGSDSNSQEIGDVLISEAIIPYEQKKVAKSIEIQRNPIPEAGQILLNRFKNYKEWSWLLPNGVVAKKLFGQILSGESLIDNDKYKQKLLKKFPAAIGGEMEGAGLYAAASRKTIEWILIKGICDFADGNKKINKKENQNIAIASAVDLCEKLLSIDSVLDELDIKKFSTIEYKKIDTTANKVLFSVYEGSCEPYYIERHIDEELFSALQLYGVWVYGQCGYGKTVTLTRNLIKYFELYTFIDLSACIGKTNDEILYVILLEFCDIYNIDIDKFIHKDNYIKNIVTILSDKMFDGSKYIYIDELPINDSNQLEDFINKIVAINSGIIAKNSKLQIKFIISTIEDPRKHLSPTSKKISETIKFIEISHWQKNDLESLIALISRELNIIFDEKIILEIIKNSKNNPRFIKCFFKNYIILNDNPKYTTQSIIEETINQVFL